jgi:hypothetical protein
MALFIVSSYPFLLSLGLLSERIKFNFNIFTAIIEDGYHWRNPYHNAVHAADVTQAMHCFLQEKMILEKLTKVEILSALLAAATHDLDHPGVNQPFLVATSNHLAALYKVRIDQVIVVFISSNAHCQR